jgi:hypothetical protein
VAEQADSRNPADLRAGLGRAQGFLGIGLEHLSGGDMEKAMGYFNKVVSLKPNHPQASAELRVLQRREEGKKSQSPILSFFKKK